MTAKKAGLFKNADLFKNVTRFTTLEEQKAIERIDLDTSDLDEFMTLLRKGLIEAAATHEKAVQENMALRVETTIRLSRPVYNDKTDRVEDLTGTACVAGEINATKVFKPGKP